MVYTKTRSEVQVIEGSPEYQSVCMRNTRQRLYSCAALRGYGSAELMITVVCPFEKGWWLAAGLSVARARGCFDLSQRTAVGNRYCWCQEFETVLRYTEIHFQIPNLYLPNVLRSFLLTGLRFLWSQANRVPDECALSIETMAAVCQGAKSWVVIKPGSAYFIGSARSSQSPVLSQGTRSNCVHLIRSLAQIS